MKEFLEKYIAVIIGIVNVVLCVSVGCLVGGENLGIRGGAAFASGFVAMLVEWLLFRDSGNVPAASVAGFVAGMILVCLI